MENYRDPYEVLGVSRDASEKDITSAYRKLAKKYHPDLNPGDEIAAKKMAEINAAYDAIKNGTADSYSSSPYGNSGSYNPYSNGYGTYDSSDGYYESGSSSNGRTYYYYSNVDPTSSSARRYYSARVGRAPFIVRIFIIIMVIRIVLSILSAIFGGIFNLVNNIGRPDYTEYRQEQQYQRENIGGDWT